MPNVERTLAEKEGAAYKPTGPAGGIDIVGPDLSAVPEEGKEYDGLKVNGRNRDLVRSPGYARSYSDGEDGEEVFDGPNRDSARVDNNANGGEVAIEAVELAIMEAVFLDILQARMGELAGRAWHMMRFGVPLMVASSSMAWSTIHNIGTP
ncbi:uncharacterized protein STEHIDRAFT_157792 [Stereum hirsutum FP-91666 SS1]|uniref:uncharacterized protein n=1 Tax=Stereum hirsutum (strain FP-91666) TaxID=721885 RepID=UPI0004449909|nr:uncharacterized protein STEHIDRAFT_157792 [Stereum hirsutum FP-91666 SS1]EIM86293.1 hypothetical protein STEHIDRAFT_157792 [Stereum hirsutum FP-91666 SS1]